MATPAEIQAQLDTSGTGMSVNIIRSARVDATYDEHYVICLASTLTRPGATGWVRTTSAGSAADQALEITNAL